MKNDVKVRLALRGINKVMTSPGAVAEVARVANRRRAAAGPGHRVIVYPHKRTARAFIEQEDVKQARKDPGGKALLRVVSGE